MRQTHEEGGQVHVAETGDFKAEMRRVSSYGGGMAGCYKHSFGEMAHKTHYVNGWTDFDFRPTINKAAQAGFAHLKAITPTTGGAGTAGFALIPVYVDPRIVDRSRKYTPLTELIPRVTNLGLTADFNVITAKGAAFTANPDASLTEADDTYSRVSIAIKFLYAVGRVLGPAEAAIPSYVLEGFNPSGSGLGGGTAFSPVGAPSAMQIEILMKARALKELEENLIINGDVSSDATQFDGIVQQQGTTNVTDLVSAEISWDDVETSIQTAFDAGGRPKLAIASSSVLRQLRTLLIDNFRYTPAQLVAGATLPFGIPPRLVLDTMLGPIPVLPAQNLSNTSGARQIFFLDTDFIEMRVLQDMTYEELAKTNDSKKFLMKIYECLILRFPGANSFIDNIG